MEAHGFGSRRLQDGIELLGDKGGEVRAERFADIDTELARRGRRPGRGTRQ